MVEREMADLAVRIDLHASRGRSLLVEVEPDVRLSEEMWEKFLGHCSRLADAGGTAVLLVDSNQVTRLRETCRGKRGVLDVVTNRDEALHALAHYVNTERREHPVRHWWRDWRGTDLGYD
jgi:hypothetical protein